MLNEPRLFKTTERGLMKTNLASNLTILFTALAALALQGCASAPQPTSDSGSEQAAASAESAPAESAAPAAESSEAPVLDEHRVFTSKIQSYDQFMKYSDMISGERYTKLIVDLRTDQVFYFDVNVYPLHSDFVFAEIYRKEQTAEALADYMVNYEAEKPEFLMAYLVHHVAQDIWAYAFWEGDEIDARGSYFGGGDGRSRWDAPRPQWLRFTIADGQLKAADREGNQQPLPVWVNLQSAVKEAAV